MFLQLAYFIYRYFRKRSVHSMNFDNPVYKKTTTEDGFHLAGQRNNCSRGSAAGPQYQHRQYGVTSPEDVSVLLGCHCHHTRQSLGDLKEANNIIPALHFNSANITETTNGIIFINIS